MAAAVRPAGRPVGCPRYYSNPADITRRCKRAGVRGSGRKELKRRERDIKTGNIEYFIFIHAYNYFL